MILRFPSTGLVIGLHEQMEKSGYLHDIPGEIVCRRASHVEPVGSSGHLWEADMSPVGGPVLGPFPTRQEALDAEVVWLERNVLLV